ncbi:hypothetical protein ACLBWT_08245 [Paenibacillus sp. D51F]
MGFFLSPAQEEPARKTGESSAASSRIEILDLDAAFLHEVPASSRNIFNFSLYDWLLFRKLNQNKPNQSFYDGLANLLSPPR